MYSREGFNRVSNKVEKNKENLSEGGRLVKELQDRIRNLVDSGDFNPGELSELSDRLADVMRDNAGTEKKLKRGEERLEKLYNEAWDEALAEDKIRDELKEATQTNDFNRIKELAEKLERLNSPRENERDFDLEGTEELRRKFAGEYRYIGGLHDSRAKVQLENGK